MRRQVASQWRSSCSSYNALSRPRVAAIEPLCRRYVRVFATPSSMSPEVGAEGIELGLESASRQPDAKFEVLGAPFSLLSVQLSPSQNLYTRRGTLVAVAGKAENAVSTLSLLSPLTRAPLGIPFLYQRISSSSPLSLLISTKSPLTSFTVLHLDGRLDWMLAQRSALLAWSGHNLTIRPRMNSRLSLQHWGNTFASGRGLIALVGKGQIYQVSLKEGEEYVAHPSNVLAYSMNGHPPQPYRFRSTTLKMQVPSLTGYLPETRFFVEMRKSPLWKFLARALYNIRTWTRRNVWGDRLFLQFKGPTTILVQSRGARLADSLSAREVNEIADVPAGVVQAALRGETAGLNAEATEPEKKAESLSKEKSVRQSTSEPAETKPAGVIWATVSREGKVDFKAQDEKP
ncbi:uncharacterized protein PV09_05748 [Verruconis gallopava]|uniref:Altered inheritance of mitochondria protein 24, mitochondrial n=1 Tax=Verruconis gallopava TaxID=253628 RepID=A0A0D2A8M9_9PEZI|nr:uncharacterized protein PV09_05748 [Verruconis gallopava]KIW03103.1 hypothetical protein PV09_05748 [Verruconis gallopava]